MHEVGARARTVRAQAAGGCHGEATRDDGAHRCGQACPSGAAVFARGYASAAAAAAAGSDESNAAGTSTLERHRSLEELGPLTLHRVRGRSDPWHAEWTRSLDEHHYLGAGGLCGAQLRYVVCARNKVVAAASFSSAALHVAARDEFIGWSARARQRNRALVIAQSRLCLTERVLNLASRVQAMLLRRVGADWEEVYGKRPVLVESYIDSTRFKGTSYQAANWKLVGHAAGRGRQDREHAAAVSTKSVCVYPLQRRWREPLLVEPVAPLAADAEWAQAEWGTVDLGDRRLTQRLVAYGRARFARPTANLPEAALAVDAVVAWRVMWLTKLGRETPDVPCSIFFEQEEWQALHCFATRTRTPPLGASTPT